YKHRFDEFKKLFKELPESGRLIVYPCALQWDILLQGRLYLSENWLCFYSPVFRGTKIALTLKGVTAITREKTARLIPNAIQVCTSTEKFFFTSFSAREKSYQGVFRTWQNVLLDKPLSCVELWQMVKQHYGNDLGLSHEEMESLQISAESSQDDSRNTSTQPRSPVPSLDRLAPERVSKRSSLPLDLNANENSVSEPSGSESIEEEEGVGTSEAQGQLYLNRVFNISASKMFELLFTNSSFMRRFMDIKKMTDGSVTAWQKDSSGNMMRSLNYTVSITNPLVGKFSTATENQTLYKESRDGHYYLVDSEVYTHDVPYHDYFYTQNRYYIIRNSKRKCRLVYTNVKYKKQPWGLVKSFITKNSWGAIEDHFRQLETELLEEEAEMNQGGGEPGKMSGLRRRRRTYSRTLPEHLKQTKQYGQDPEQHRDGSTPVDMKGPYRWSTKAIVTGMSVLLILMAMNLGLFFKLRAMEDIAHRMYLSTKHRLRERTEAQLFKTVLQDSINLLEQLRSSLVVLQQNFALANRTAAPQ
uniref:VASt domain-containing protein n=1 Tax=Mola mola TaxID=94237 RepID=A0A3Q3VX28_MOLML